MLGYLNYFDTETVVVAVGTGDGAVVGVALSAESQKEWIKIMPIRILSAWAHQEFCVWIYEIIRYHLSMVLHKCLLPILKDYRYKQ